MLVVGFVGSSGAGKTTLMEKVLAALVARGQRVSAVKSTHHDTDVDKPGKDSWRFREAGASEVILAGRERWALMRETPEGEASLSELLSRLAPVDIVLVEGFKSEEGIPRIGVARKAFGKPLPPSSDYVAVATDDEMLELPALARRLPVDEPEAVADFVEELKKTIEVQK